MIQNLGLFDRNIHVDLECFLFFAVGLFLVVSSFCWSRKNKLNYLNSSFVLHVKPSMYKLSVIISMWSKIT